MKPKIKRVCIDNEWQWKCSIRSMVSGYGRTPYEAYQSWYHWNWNRRR